MTKSKSGSISVPHGFFSTEQIGNTIDLLVSKGRASHPATPDDWRPSYAVVDHMSKQTRLATSAFNANQLRPNPVSELTKQSILAALYGGLVLAAEVADVDPVLEVPTDKYWDYPVSPTIDAAASPLERLDAEFMHQLARTSSATLHISRLQGTTGEQVIGQWQIANPGMFPQLPHIF